MFNERITIPKHFIARGLLLALASSVVLAAGCGIGPAAAPDLNTYSSPAVLTGLAKGGQTPIANATVKLYEAGYTGYGSAGTLLATAVSSPTTGIFTFVKSGTNGSSGITTPNWACPVSANDPQIYIIITGGNTTGVTSGFSTSTNENTAIGLIAALGPCSKISSNSFTIVDEEVTAATVYALAQYMNPGTTPGTESIGTSSTTQGAVGLNNAVASIANITATPATYTGTGTASTITVTATADSAKLATIADILSTCINNLTQTTTTYCAQLFAGAKPPTASTTSQTNATFSTAQDTIQAAYYMATNPIDSGTPSTPCSPTYTSNVACLFGLVTAAGGQFPGALSSAPLDWTIGVTYTASGLCPYNAPFFSGPVSAAIDAKGNIWLINASVSAAAFVEMSPIGQPMQCQGSVAGVGAQSYGAGITIDTGGNVWAIYSHNTKTNLIQELPYGTSTTVTYTPTFTPNAITADGNGNVFFSGNATAANGGELYEFVDPGVMTATNPPPAVVAQTGYNGTTATTLGYLAADSAGRIWASTTATTNLYGTYPSGTPATAPITAYQVTSNVVTFTAANTFTVGQAVTISGLTTGTQFNGQTMLVVTDTAANFTAAFTTANTSLTADAGTATAAQAYTNAATAEATTSFGLAIGTGDYVFTGTSCCGSPAAHEAEKVTPAATAVAGKYTASAQYLGGLVGTRAVAVDGAQNVWMTNVVPETGTTTSAGIWGLTELTATGSGTTVAYTALSPAGTSPGANCTTTVGCPAGGGFQDSNLLADMDIEIDPSGNVWAVNSGTFPTGLTALTPSGTSVTEFIGAAVPVITPKSVAAKNATIATMP